MEIITTTDGNWIFVELKPTLKSKGFIVNVLVSSQPFPAPPTPPDAQRQQHLESTSSFYAYIYDNCIKIYL